MSVGATELARPIEAASFALLRSVQTLERCRLLAHAIVFGMALLSLFVSGYAVYVAAIVAVISQGAAFTARLIANHQSSIAHSLLRVSMLIKAFRISPDQFDLAYLMSRISPSMQKEAQAPHHDPSGDYAAPETDDGPSRLRWMIQENAYFNNVLYELCAEKALRIILTTTVALVVFAFLLFPLAGSQSEYIVPRVFIIILSVAALYDQIECWATWRDSSRVMLHLEQELARLRTVPNHRILLTFSNYHITISASPAIDRRVYELNRDKLNASWKQRMATLRNEWASSRHGSADGT